MMVLQSLNYIEPKHQLCLVHHLQLVGLSYQGTKLLSTSTKLEVYSTETEANYNLSLQVPHTPTSCRYNLWNKTLGELYLYACDIPLVNGIYSLVSQSATGTSRVWTRTCTLYNVTTKFSIRYKNAKWVLQQEVNSVITDLFRIDSLPSGVEPWLGTWTHITDESIKAPVFQSLNFDNTEYSIQVDDVLYSINQKLSNYTFNSVLDIEKQILYDEETKIYSIHDPVDSWFLFLDNRDNSSASTTGINYIDGDDTVGTGAGALYIRDLERQSFDPTKYLSLAQLYNFLTCMIIKSRR